jgi:hypothetical protein
LCLHRAGNVEALEAVGSGRRWLLLLHTFFRRLRQVVTFLRIPSGVLILSLKGDPLLFLNKCLLSSLNFAISAIFLPDADIPYYDAFKAIGHKGVEHNHQEGDKAEFQAHIYLEFEEACNKAVRRNYLVEVHPEEEDQG